MASAIFFGTVVFATVALATRSAWSDNWSIVAAAQNPRSSALNVTSLSSIYTFLHHLSVLGLILFYAYMCEYHPPFAHSEKSYDRDEFFFLTGVLLLVSYFTLQKNDPDKPMVTSSENSTSSTPSKDESKHSAASLCGERAVAPVNDNTEILNRDQTEEWKGWMQFMFLNYHYFHAEETYNAIRIMITCYVWMTGFGNFSFFYVKGDYGLVRVLQMLWRLNFLVFFLCLTQSTTYILYYICLLHTYFFLMVYLTMRIAKHVNYSKWGIRVKLFILALIIFFVWDVDTGLFRLMHMPFLGEHPMLGATAGPMWEWYFRSSLDHWSTFLGMVFALNFPITSLFFRKLEAQPFHLHFAAKAAMGIVLLVASTMWVTGPFQLGKFSYNQTNAYFGIVPVLTYIYFRNLTSWLRSNTMDLLHQIGKTTLETYLMQHHIWLTSDAKTLLTLIPGWPKCNFLLVSIIYVIASRRLYQLTLFLRGMMLPNNRDVCIRNLLAIACVTIFFLGLAWLLKLASLLNLPMVGAVSLILGFGLYHAVLAKTRDANDSTSAQEVGGNLNNQYRFVVPGSGAVVVLLIGLIWHHAAKVGSGRIIPLPRSCEKAVLDGAWVPIDSCNEGTRGAGYRDYGMGSFGTCSAYTWGWTMAPSSMHCRMARRDAKQLRSMLIHRNITFVGDSGIRHLYHASCRQLGDYAAGAYNTSMEKHSDFSRQYGSTAMEFRWAPYVGNLSSFADALLPAEVKPDLVVMGGGAWDKLHMFRDEDEQTTLQNSVTALRDKLESLSGEGVPVAWVVPTTINTWALNTDLKRENIREDQMESFRELYRQLGVNEAASFVLNGVAFTVDRVDESYDGVHYPLDVYDGGAQIFFNAADWLLLEREPDVFVPPKPGSMDNPLLGVCMLLFVAIGIFTLDGFMGVSYLAAIFVPKVAPMALCEEAFHSLHRRLQLPSFDCQDPPLIRQILGRKANRRIDKVSNSERGVEDDEENEMASLVLQLCDKVAVVNA